MSCYSRAQPNLHLKGMIMTHKFEDNWLHRQIKRYKLLSRGNISYLFGGVDVSLFKQPFAANQSTFFGFIYICCA